MEDNIKEASIYLRDKLVKAGMDDVIVNSNVTDSSLVKFAKNKIVKTGTERLIFANVFVVKDKRVLVTSLKEFSKKEADELVEKIKSYIKFIKAKEYYGIAKGPFVYKSIEKVYDNKIENLDSVDMVEKGINAAFDSGAKRADGIFERHLAEKFLLTSNNVEVMEKGSYLYFSLRAFLDKDATGHLTSACRVLNELDVEEVGRVAGEIAVEAKNPEDAKAGKYDVLFDPLALTPLWSSVAASSSIFSVESGLSFFKNKLNKEVASDNVNFIDDGRLAGGYRSRMFDDEGFPCKENIIIKEGVLNNYLHNTSTAVKYKVKSTGNAGLISPVTTNFYLVKGKRSRDEMIKGIDKGLIITNVWYTRFQNYFTGDFSTIPRDGVFLIENGNIVKSLKNLRISDNMIRILKNIEEIGKNSRQVKSWEADDEVITPSVLVRDVNITKPVE